MEKGKVIKQGVFELSSLVLAYVGDAVYELFIRTQLVDSGEKVGELHETAVDFVRASAQAEVLRKLKPKLRKEEWAVAKRARNTKNNNVPKNTSLEDYHLSTGFEALLGYLYLSGKAKRLDELLWASYDIISTKK